MFNDKRLLICPAAIYLTETFDAPKVMLKNSIGDRL